MFNGAVLIRINHLKMKFLLDFNKLSLSSFVFVILSKKSVE